MRIGVAALALLALAATSHAACGGDFHVGPDGDDARDGRTAATAWRTVQHAADVLTAGQTVCVHPGTYRERVTVRHSGTAGKPITFRGDGATLDGGDRPSGAWTRTPDDVVPGAGGRVWQRELGYAPAHCTWRGQYVVAMDSPRTDWKKALVDGPLTDPSAQGRTPAARFGWQFADAVFHVEGPTTFVRFADGHAPGPADDLSFCPADTGTFSTGGQSWIAVTGFTIQGCENAVRVPGGAHVVVRGNTLRHGRRTVQCAGCAASTFEDNDVTLAYGRDLAASAPDHWGVWQVFRVNGSYPRMAFDVGGAGSADNVVAGNRVHDCFDGISDWDGTDLKPEEYGNNARFTVRDNVVSRCANDAFMAREGGQDARWYDNRALDVNVGFRLRVYAGPTWIYRNLVYAADGPALDGAFAYVWQGFPGRVHLYHNSASTRRGVVWGKAVGLPPGLNARDGAPHLFVWDNVFSAVTPVEFWARDWNAPGVPRPSWRYNWHANGTGRQMWMDDTNVIGDGRRLWPPNAPPTFVLPPGSTARGAAAPVTAPDAATFRPWPGFDAPAGAERAAAGTPRRLDMGAVQGDGRPADRADGARPAAGARAGT